MKVTERGQITIPKAIRVKYGITPATEIEVADKAGVITVVPKRDSKKFEAALKRWYGTGAKRMKELGFEAGDDLIEAMRGR